MTYDFRVHAVKKMADSSSSRLDNIEGQVNCSLLILASNIIQRRYGLTVGLYCPCYYLRAYAYVSNVKSVQIYVLIN